jgi:hypothetical protein
MRLAPKAHPSGHRNLTELKRRTRLKTPPRLISNSQSQPYSPQSLIGPTLGSDIHPGWSLHKTVLLYQFECSSKGEPESFGYQWAYALKGR